MPAVRLRWGTSRASRTVWLLTRSKPSNSTLPRTRCNGASHGSAIVCDQARFFTRAERVAALILSGFVNAWILVGSFRGLVVTGYGQLLMLKLAAFAVMLAFAAFNRFVLTPRLALSSDQARQDALRALSRNTWIEIVLGLSIFAIVGVLGTLHPAAHLVQ